MEPNKPNTKASKLAEALKQRIAGGDYLLRPFPTDDMIAQEAGVNRRTARKAVQMLIDEGLLFREPNSRVTVNRKQPSRQIALLMPALPHPSSDHWHRSIELAVAKRGWNVRVVGYTHWTDHSIHTVLNEFDGVFFLPHGKAFPPFVIEQLQHPDYRVVVLNANLSDVGVPSVWLTSPILAVRSLLDHLWNLGHRQIAYLNVQPYDQVTELRLQEWRSWAGQHVGNAELFNEPLKEFELECTQKAYEVTWRALTSGRLRATAILCSTSTAAIGANRAIYERGLQVGRAISLCSLDDAGGEAPFFTPSLTCVQDPDPAPYLEICLDWMGGEEGKWGGSLLVEPPHVNLFKGESTGRALDDS